MSKGKYFLKNLEKAIHSDFTYLNGEKIKMISPCCDGNKVAHGDGYFICERFKMEIKGKDTVAHFFTLETETETEDK